MAPARLIASRSAAHLLAVAGLLALLFALRVHRPLEMPIFVDESLHILRGRVVWQFSDLGESLNPKKLLFYYWIGLFGLNAPEAAWLARAATALWAPLGGALTYALARRLFAPGAGLLALALYALAPPLVFFERLALADAFTASIGVALAIAALRLASRPTLGRGLIAGALLGAAALAKLIALPLGALIPLAIALRQPDRGRAVLAPRFRRPLIAVGLGCFLVLAPVLAYLLAQAAGWAPVRVVVEEELYSSGDRAAQIAGNIEQAARALITLLSPGWIALAGLLAVALARWRPRALAYLAAGALLPWIGVVLIAGQLSTRYLVLGVPFLLVIVAGGVIELTGRARPAAWAAWIALGLWALAFAGPFARQAMTDPAALDLPARDRWEYVTNTSSGYALRDLARDLPDLPPGADGRIAVIGWLPACHTLPLYWTAPNAVALDCPLFRWDPSAQDAMTARLIGLAEREPVLYMAVERLSVYDLDRLPFTWTLLREYARPHDGAPVRLYRVALAE